MPWPLVKIAGVAVLALGGLAALAGAIFAICWVWLYAIDQISAAFGVSRAVKEYIWHRREFRRWQKQRRGEYEVDE